MKKILTVVMLLASVMAMQAQDTLYTRSLKSNYLGYKWVLDTGDYTYAYQSHNYFCGNCKEIIKHFYSKDSIQIYGLAVSLLYRTDIAGQVYDRTDSSNSFEYFCIYEPDSIAFHPVSDSLVFDRFWTPIEYYMDLQLLYPIEGWGYHPPFPFSEVYFNEPYAVQDSFLIGFTHRSAQHMYRDTVTGRRYMFSRYPLETSSFLLIPDFSHKDFDLLSITYFDEYAAEAGRRWNYFYSGTPYMIYPILTPRDPSHNPQDTTHHSGGDTLGVGKVQTLERFVSLLPNPASGRVQVVSSIGLKHVEVYNPAGVKVMELPASGLSLTLPLDALPEDTYLVRIATPTGTVTKKLVVSRQ